MKIKDMYNKMIDMTNIFGLFVPGEQLDGTSTATSLNELKTKPIYHVGMYKKLIQNHLNFNNRVLKFFHETNQDFDIVDVKAAGEYVVFNRAWSYIVEVDLKNKDYIHAIKHYSDKDFHNTLDLGIEFFIKDELYERCAHLLEIKKKSIKLQK
tara:strand:- start:249 stop:707 length:459 start_codon:yes stop_codon:yes gene_type:complete